MSHKSHVDLNKVPSKHKRHSHRLRGNLPNDAKPPPLDNPSWLERKNRKRRITLFNPWAPK